MIKTATILLLLFFSTISAQNKNREPEPELFEGIHLISKFISQNFSEPNIDLSLNEKITLNQKVIDKVYFYAIEIYNGNISEALLALTFATLPFNKIEIALPFNRQLVLKLPSANKNLFQLKNKYLPKYFLFDSPNNNFGDKDKLAHFFGSAFLSYNFPFFNFSNLLGIFIEMFEETFSIKGGMDFRDLEINNLGAQFGKSLDDNFQLPPSFFFKVFNLFYIRVNHLENI